MHTIKELGQILALAPQQHSRFEILTFEIAKHLTIPRQIRYVLQKVTETERDLRWEQDKIKAHKGLTAPLANPELIKLQGTIDSLKEELDIYYEWLEKFTKEELKTHMLAFQAEDHNYWINKVGMQAAIDMLTHGKMSRETIEKMMMFEREHFVKAVFVATELSNAFQQNTVEAERLMNGEGHQ